MQISLLKHSSPNPYGNCGQSAVVSHGVTHSPLKQNASSPYVPGLSAHTPGSVRHSLLSLQRSMLLPGMSSQLNGSGHLNPPGPPQASSPRHTPSMQTRSPLHWVKLVQATQAPAALQTWPPVQPVSVP